MTILQKSLPHRMFDVGIAEGHSVTFSGGMAKEGLLPYCNIYSAFSQRAYDNIIHDVALLKLPVVLCLDRADSLERMVRLITAHLIWQLCAQFLILQLPVPWMSTS